MVMLMRWWHVTRMGIRSLIRRERADAELSRELRFHVEQESEEYITRGMRPEDARGAALRRFGDMTKVQEECRDMRQMQYIENIGQDLRYAARSLARTPGFTAVILLTLALSIGANSAIFSVIEGVLLKPLPYTDPDRIVRVFYHNAQYAKFAVNHFDLRDFRSTAQSFESIAAYTHTDLQLSGAGEPVRLAGFRVTGGFFHVLGLRPARGREFGQNDEIPNSGRVAILSDRVWKDQFGSDPGIIGRKIILDTVPFEVVGVMPPGTDHPGNFYNPVAYGQTVDVWTPFVFDGNSARRGSHYVEAIARLKPGVTPSQAESELNGLMADLAKRYNSEKGWTTMVIPLYQEVVGGSRRLLLVLLGAVGLVLLIACVNAANLLLARATARQREIAVRTALGAGRGRLIRQMLTESLLIAIASGAAGVAIAAVGTKALVLLLPADFPRAASISLDRAMLGWTFFITLGTGLLFGLAPALQAARFDVQQSLRECGRGTSAGKRHMRLRIALVVGEVAMACVLLVGAGLMLRSFVNLLQLDPGFRPQKALSATVSLPQTNYKNSQDIARFFERGLAEWKNLAGVQAAGVGTDLPWTGYDDNMGGWKYDGGPADDSSAHARYHVASSDYFRALGIPLMRGRFFEDTDAATSAKVLIINEAMARRYWPNQDAIGKRIDFGFSKEPTWTTIVGIVGDVKDQPNSAAAEPAFWWPVAQMPFPFPKMSLVFRTANDPSGSLVNSLRESIRGLDSSLALADIRILDDVAGKSFSTPRFALFLVALFAGLALTLAATGVYGVISYAVTQRMHEFGMRMALGAKRRDIMQSVLAQGLKMAAVGVAAGLVGAAVLGRFLGTLLYEVEHLDPLTFAGVALLAIGVAVLACYIPSRRATGADPMQALRSE